ncbi:phosphatase PAP2 family protein [Salinicoccus sp. Marseille-QA3877]
MRRFSGVTGCIFLLIFLGISIGVITEKQWVYTFDITWINFIQSFITPPLTAVVSILTDIGGVREIIFLTILVTVFLFLRKWYAAGLWLGGTVLFSTVILTFIKIFVGRERPDILVIATEQSQSFPSGHSTLSTVFYGLLGFTFITLAKKTSQKIIIAATASLIIGFVMLSRIYLGAHFPSDVLGGLSFGSASTLISLYVYQFSLPYLQKFLLQWKLADRSPVLFK